MSAENPVRILIIDQDRADRDFIIAALEAIEYVKVVGRAAGGSEALTKITVLKPDIVMLEYELPGIIVENFLAEIRRVAPDTEVILTSESRRTSAESSMLALELGALYFVRKPRDVTRDDYIRYFSKYLRPVINLFHVNRTASRVRQASKNIVVPRRSVPAAPTRTAAPSAGFSLLAVGSSLGGPEALHKFIPRLPADFGLPVVVVQHMPQGFTASLAEHLDEVSKLIVMEAAGGEKLRPGYVYLAPGGRHLVVQKDRGFNGQYRLGLDDGPAVHGCRPSVNRLFESIAGTVRGNILTVVLTGMGEDGLDGVRALKEKGQCFCITQDEATSVVFGMPGVIVRHGLSDLSLPIDSIAPRVSTLAEVPLGITPNIR